jgi:hypothetical protein
VVTIWPAVVMTVDMPAQLDGSASRLSIAFMVHFSCLMVWE